MGGKGLKKVLPRFNLLEFIKQGCEPPQGYKEVGLLSIYRVRQDFQKARRVRRLNLLFRRDNVMEEWTEIKTQFILEQMENMIRLNKKFNLPNDEPNFLGAMETYRRELFKVCSEDLLDDRKIDEYLNYGFQRQ